MTVELRWRVRKWDRKATLMCKLFGHVWRGGWFGRTPYLKPTAGPVDGIGRHHISLKCRCDRCGGEYLVAHVHDWSEPRLGSKDHHYNVPEQSSRKPT